MREGAVDSYRNLAEVGQISRARMSQILRLTDLAPSIQEQILFLPRTLRGADPVTETDLRQVARIIDWESQRTEFASVMNSRQQA